MKKIMFNERYGLQQATFDGTKTMTRRIVPDKIMKDALAYQSHHIEDEKAYEKYILEHAPYKVGEIVAIAQRYSQLEKEIERLGLPLNLKPEIYKMAGYKNKMFVKGDDMPHHIQITSIRVEHLQDITDEDCMKEGVLSSDKYAMPYGIPYNNGGVFSYYSSPREAYADLIDKVSGQGTWDSNPLVFAYEYKRID